MSYSADVEDFENVQEVWEAILPHSNTNTIFVTPWWQQSWWRVFGEGSNPHTVVVRDGDDVAGIAPLMLNDRTLSFAGDKELFDYLDFVVVKGKEAPFFDALCDHIVQLDWHTMTLSSIPEGSPTLEYLPALGQRKGFSVKLEQGEMTPTSYLPGTWDEFVSGLRKKDRHELRRKLRRLDQSEETRQYICNDPESLNCCMQDFFRLLRDSSPEKNEFLTAEREEFFLDIAQTLALRDQFKLYFLEVEGVRVASCICFDYADSYLLYNSGYDPNFSHLSVGLLNKALSIKDAIEEGRHSFNFLKGTERYKYNLGAVDNAVYNLEVTR